MSLQLDHFFILVEQGAPEAASLVAAGFDEGSSNSHPGQGTANRRFFFADTVVELLYVRDEAEEVGGEAVRLRFSARFRSKTASPFGFVFRSTSEEDVSVLGPTWPYHPEYLPPGTHMEVADGPDTLVEPMIIIMPPTMPGGKREETRNPQSLSKLHLTVPAISLSQALNTLATLNLFDIRVGTGHLLEVEFDHGSADKYCDLRPKLPVVVRC